MSPTSCQTAPPRTSIRYPIEPSRDRFGAPGPATDRLVSLGGTRLRRARKYTRKRFCNHQSSGTVARLASPPCVSSRPPASSSRPPSGPPGRRRLVADRADLPGALLTPGPRSLAVMTSAPLACGYGRGPLAYGSQPRGTGSRPLTGLGHVSAGCPPAPPCTCRASVLNGNSRAFIFNAQHAATFFRKTRHRIPETILLKPLL